MAKRTTTTYDQEFKSQAVKLAQEIGGHKAAGRTSVLPIAATALGERELRQ